MNFTPRPCHWRESPRLHRRTFGTPATPIRRLHSCGNGKVSARKLAAGLWWLRSMNNGSKRRNLKCGPLVIPRCKPGVVDINTHCNSREYCAKKVHLLCSSTFMSSLKNGVLLKFTMEEATKWDRRRSRISNEKYCFYSLMKLLEDQVTTVSVASAVQAELVLSQLQIHELQDERLIFKKKVEGLQRKLAEEINSCQIREHKKLYAVVADLKNELKRERKNCRKMEIFNSKLVNELLKAKSSAKQLTEAYEKEKKARVSVEKVCNKLTNKFAEENVDIEVMKMETVRIQEQLEEERKMLQMAEVWREERVQMKLTDAKLVLEEKYSQLNKLVTDLENFLRCKGSTLNVMELRNAEMIRQETKTVNVRETEEFSYVPPKSSDIYSIFEEVRQMEANKRANEMVNELSTASNGSRNKTATSVGNCNKNQHLLQHLNGFTGDSSQDDGKFVGHAESSHSFEGGKLSINKSNQCKISGRHARKCDENMVGQDSTNTQFSELCSVSAGQPMQKSSSVSKLRKSSLRKKTSNGSSEMQSSNTSASVVTTSLNRESHVATNGHWRSSDIVNPHVVRAMKVGTVKPKAIQNKT